jgi:tetratricopeptide (TPR) repeat protein
MSRRPLLQAVWIGALGTLLMAPLATAAGQQRLTDLFAQANEASARGELERAIDAYGRLLDAGVDDADVHFNLATAHARAGQHGAAILYFERALALRPGDRGAGRGLAAARSALDQRRVAQGGNAGLDTGRPFLEALARLVPAQALAFSILGLNALLFGFLAARRFVRHEGIRTGLGAGASIAAVTLLTAGVLLAVQQGAFREGEPGVVLIDDAVLREAPDPRAASRGKAREGQRVRVLERHGRYLRVKTRKSREGWMTGAEVEAI